MVVVGMIGVESRMVVEEADSASKLSLSVNRVLTFVPFRRSVV